MLDDNQMLEIVEEIETCVKDRLPDAPMVCFVGQNSDGAKSGVVTSGIVLEGKSETLSIMIGHLLAMNYSKMRQENPDMPEEDLEEKVLGTFALALIENMPAKEAGMLGSVLMMMALEKEVPAPRRTTRTRRRPRRRR